MKKILAVILAFVYLSSSMGATVRLHYCMGKLAEWSLEHGHSKSCTSCGMNKAGMKGNDCCKDEYKFVKSDTDQKTTEANFQMIQLVSADLPVSFYETQEHIISSITEETPVSHAPPRSSAVAEYILYRTFLI